MTIFRSNGKLLITGEYVVLDGALSLAVPTKFGQSLSVEISEKKGLNWKAYDHEKKCWLEAFYKPEDLVSSQNAISSTKFTSEENYLLKIMQVANSLNPKILSEEYGYNITTHLDFPRDWGLGTSSTLINNIAQWFKIDPYKLLEQTFGGSGYDIAAAQHNTPITYTLSEKKGSVLKASFNPSFKEELFFVYLNRKQNSRDSIKHYKQQSKSILDQDIAKISSLTNQFLNCETLKEFELLIEIHETIISKLIESPKIKSELFPDFSGAIKSLGGWGGDFVLVTGKESDMNYFREKDYKTIIPYTQMAL